MKNKDEVMISRLTNEIAWPRPLDVRSQDDKIPSVIDSRVKFTRW